MLSTLSRRTLIYLAVFYSLLDNIKLFAQTSQNTDGLLIHKKTVANIFLRDVSAGHRFSSQQ